jgi:hypothetical protein
MEKVIMVLMLEYQWGHPFTQLWMEWYQIREIPLKFVGGFNMVDELLLTMAMA